MYSNAPPGGSTGCLADDARALDALDLAVGVGDDPLARDELRRFRPDVRDADVVLKEVLLLARRAALGEELAATWMRMPRVVVVARADALDRRIRERVGPAAAVVASLIMVSVHGIRLWHGTSARTAADAEPASACGRSTVHDVRRWSPQKKKKVSASAAWREARELVWAHRRRLAIGLA